MKTKDFIKMLEKEDPTGEGHIRMPGGIPWFADAKEGYWDGPYQYIDEDGNLITSIKGYKVDIRCMDVEDFVGNHFYYHNPNNWEEIKSKFKFELNDYCVEAHRNERAESVLKMGKEEHDLLMEIHGKNYQESIKYGLKLADKGYKFFQQKEYKYRNNYHDWIIIDENSIEKKGTNQYTTEGIIHSGLFDRSDNGVKEGYYQWVKN